MIFTFSSFGTRIFKIASLLNVAFTFRGSMAPGSVTERWNSPQKHSFQIIMFVGNSVRLSPGTADREHIFIDLDVQVAQAHACHGSLDDVVVVVLKISRATCPVPDWDVAPPPLAAQTALSDALRVIIPSVSAALHRRCMDRRRRYRGKERDHFKESYRRSSEERKKDRLEKSDLYEMIFR